MCNGYLTVDRLCRMQVPQLPVRNISHVTGYEAGVDPRTCHKLLVLVRTQTSLLDKVM